MHKTSLQQNKYLNNYNLSLFEIIKYWLHLCSLWYHLLYSKIMDNFSYGPLLTLLKPFSNECLKWNKNLTDKP